MNNEKKSIFNPIDKGINPRIVVIAVKRTGLNLAEPLSIIAFINSFLTYQLSQIFNFYFNDSFLLGIILKT